MWEKELELIESLGKLYPIIYDDFEYKDYQESNFRKAGWVYYLCAYHLERRLPQLERFINEKGGWIWFWYKDKFNIKE